VTCAVQQVQGLWTVVGEVSITADRVSLSTFHSQIPYRALLIERGSVTAVPRYGCAEWEESSLFFVLELLQVISTFQSLSACIGRALILFLKDMTSLLPVVLAPAASRDSHMTIQCQEMSSLSHGNDGATVT